MRYLVLGSEGQIGKPLVQFLKKKGHYVIEFDIATDTDKDLCIPHILDDILEWQHIDFCFFLACDVGGSTYLEKYQNTFSFLNNNVKIILNTFESLKQFNIPFIFTSSQMSNMTHSSYGLCKAIGEKYTNILDGLCVHFWNVYGCEHDPEKTHVITDFINMARNGRIEMKTDGQEQRQFLYVDDCCECLYDLSLKYEFLDKTKSYHITSFEWISILDIAKIIQRKFHDVDIIANKKKDTVQFDQLNQPDPYILTYWKPKTSIFDGIQKVLNMM